MKIVLRPITLQDGVHLVKWRNDEKVINHCLSRATITEESNKEFYGRTRQTLWEECTDANPKLSLNDT